MVGMNHGAIALVLLAGVASAADSPLQPLDFLVGHCWRGTFPDGKAVDTHCFESMLGGHFVRDRHVVRGERPDYSGESIYWFDPKSKRVSYVYFNSDGGQSTGTLAVDGERLQFGDETYTGPDGKVQRYRTVWERNGADAYVATTEREANGTWTSAWRIEFARVPPGK